MGCNSSKPATHRPLDDRHAGANGPAQYNNAANRPVNSNTHAAQHGNYLEQDAFAEPQLEQIDNGLWRDTQHEVAIHNTRQEYNNGGYVEQRHDAIPHNNDHQPIY